MEFRAKVDYINKDGEVEFSQGGGVSFIAGVEGESVTVEDYGQGPNGEASTSVETSVGIPFLKGVSGYETTTDSETGSSTRTLKAGGEIGGSMGVGFVLDATFGFGVKINYKDDEPDKVLE